MESPVASLDLCADGQGAKCKSKAVLNRRPSGYWKVFSAWWRGRFQALKTRPTVHEVIEWYNKNAATSWPAGQVPSLKAVLRQSKGLRPIDGLKEYFREYRKKRKQQGGHTLTANEDAPAFRRARPAKRRRARSSRDDSSDEDEMEAELSVCSDEEVETQACSEDGEMAVAEVAECQDGAAAAEADEPSSAAAPVAAETASKAVAVEGALPAASQLLPGKWLPDTPTAAAAAAASPSADLTLQPVMFSGAEQVGFSQPSFVPHMQQLESPFMPLAAIPPKNAVHPAVAGCMVPLAGAGCSNSSTPSLGAGPSLDFFDALPSEPFVVLPAVPVRRGPPRVTARTRRAAAATLPPLAPSSLSPQQQQQQQQPAQSEEEHAADRCSAGGCMPPPCGRTFHQGFDGAGSHCYYPPYGPPMPYNAYPHAVCTCYPPRPSFPDYRAPSADCSSGGAASSGCCGLMSAQCFPPPHHQHQAAWSWYGPEPSCPYACCAAPPPPCAIAGCRCSSPMPSPPHMPYAAWHGPHGASARSEPWEAAASPVAQHGGAEHTSDVEVCSNSGPENFEQHKHHHHHHAAMMHLMHHGRPAAFAYPHQHHQHNAPCPPWARQSMPACAPPPCGMITVGSTNSVASLEVESGMVGAPSAEPCRLQRTSWPFAHDHHQPHAPAVASPAPAFKCAAATAECDASLPRLDSLGAAGREGLDHELGMAWESFLNDGTDAMVDSVLIDV